MHFLRLRPVQHRLHVNSGAAVPNCKTISARVSNAVADTEALSYFISSQLRQLDMQNFAPHFTGCIPFATSCRCLTPLKSSTMLCACSPSPFAHYCHNFRRRDARKYHFFCLREQMDNGLRLEAFGIQNEQAGVIERCRDKPVPEREFATRAENIDRDAANFQVRQAQINRKHPTPLCTRGQLPVANKAFSLNLLPKFSASALATRWPERLGTGRR